MGGHFIIPGFPPLTVPMRRPGLRVSAAPEPTDLASIGTERSGAAISDASSRRLKPGRALLR